MDCDEWYILRFASLRERKEASGLLQRMQEASHHSVVRSPWMTMTSNSSEVAMTSNDTLR